MSTSSTGDHREKESPAAAAKRKWWHSRRAKLTGLALLVTAILGGSYWYAFLLPFVSTDDARVAATTVRVANLGAGAPVVKLNVQEGSRVKRGDVLVELDHRDAEAKYRRAEVRADSSRRERKRMQQLFSQKGIAPSQFDKAQEEAEAADAEFRLAAVALERTYLKSPIDGIVVQKLTETGNLLESGQVAISVVDLAGAWIAANIEETKVGAIRIGQPVSIDVDEGASLSGRVSEIRSATAAQFALIPAENPSGNFIKLVQRIPVKVALDPHPSDLRVGQSAEIRIRVR